MRHMMDPVFEMIDRRFSTANGKRFDTPISRWIRRFSETNPMLGVILRSALIATSTAAFFLLVTSANFLIPTVFVWIIGFAVSGMVCVV